MVRAGGFFLYASFFAWESYCYECEEIVVLFSRDENAWMEAIVRLIANVPKACAFILYALD